jgi:hypothetical protein
VITLEPAAAVGPASAPDASSDDERARRRRRLLAWSVLPAVVLLVPLPAPVVGVAQAPVVVLVIAEQAPALRRVLAAAPPSAA